MLFLSKNSQDLFKAYCRLTSVCQVNCGKAFNITEKRPFSNHLFPSQGKLLCIHSPALKKFLWSSKAIDLICQHIKN